MADDSDFTVVSYDRKTRTRADESVPVNTAKSAISNTTEVISKSPTNDVEMQTVNVWRFQEFQQHVMRLIHQLIDESSNKNHIFIQRWISATTGPKSINQDSSFRAVANVLNLKDIQDYRRFLSTAPNIEKYLVFGNNTRSTTLQYYVVPRVHNHDTTTAQEKYNSGNKEPSLKTNQDSTPPSIDGSITSPENYSHKPDGSESNITSPSNPDAPVSITQTKQDDGGDSITFTNLNYKVCYGNADDFTEMMETFWPYILRFMSQDSSHNHSKQWERWITQGLTSTTDLSTLKIITGIDTFDQLYLFLRDSPALSPFYDISWDHRIIYQKRADICKNDSGSPSQIVNEPSRVYTIRMLADNDMEFCIFHKRVYTEITAWHNGGSAISDTKWMQWRKWMFAGLKSIQPARDIKRILGVTTIHEYVQAMQPYAAFQEKFILYDAQGDTVKYSYSTSNNQMIQPTAEDFEHFHSHFFVRVNQLTLQLNNIQDKVDGYEHTLKSFYAQQRVRLETVVNGIITDSITSFKATIDNILTDNIQGGLSDIFRNNLADITQQTTSAYEKQIDTIGRDMLQEICSAADDAQAAQAEHYESMLHEFNITLQQKKDALAELQQHKSPPTQQDPPLHQPTLIQSRRFPNVRPVSPFVRKPNPYDTPNNTPVVTNVTAHATSGHNPTMDAHTGGPVHPVSSNQSFTGLNNQHHRLGHHGTHQPDTSSIPHTVQTGLVQLPPVNHDQALKRAKIQFSGLGDIFVFYSQLMNAMEQFGIYLLPLPKVQYQTSLCPATYGGIPIDAHRRQIMAGTLYQKLQSPDVIPVEYTAMRNIINRFAEKNDGYEVLYAMLENVHPALQKDAVMCPPKSSECGDDIHVYAQKFDAWIRYETYANRPYSPREQINKFVNELSPTFAPAISRVRRLLDAWNPWDLVVPEVLKITALPNTIERFMHEEAGTGTPYIRAVNDGRKHRPSSKTGKGIQHKVQPPPSDVSDKLCSFCGCRGHEPPQCHFMAKLIIANESLTKVDPKVKKELKENLRQQQKQRREQRLRRHANTIRQLIDQGGTKEEIEAALDNMQSDTDLDYTARSLFNDDDDVQSSSSSSSE